jgi:hypothetical protein
MFVSCECCVVRYRSLRLADHSSRGVLPSVVCLSVISSLDNEEAVGHWGGGGGGGCWPMIKKLKTRVKIK